MYKLVKEYHTIVWEEASVENLADLFTDGVKLSFAFGSFDKFECNGIHEVHSAYKSWAEETPRRTETAVNRYAFKKLDSNLCRVEYTIEQYKKAKYPGQYHQLYRSEYEELIKLRWDGQYLIDGVEMRKLSATLVE